MKNWRSYQLLFITILLLFAGISLNTANSLQAQENTETAQAPEVTPTESVSVDVIPSQTSPEASTAEQTSEPSQNSEPTQNNTAAESTEPVITPEQTSQAWPESTPELTTEPVTLTPEQTTEPVDVTPEQTSEAWPESTPELTAEPPLDSDGDGWADTLDNCPTVPNPSQSDFDNDFLGDFCDTNPILIASFDTLELSSGTYRFSNSTVGELEWIGWAIFDINDNLVSFHNENSFDFTFTQSGQYRIELTVARAGQYSTIQSFVTVSYPLSCAFDAVQLNSEVPTDVAFTNECQGRIDTYLWDFGDGNSSSEPNPVHSYNAAGIYNVQLSVTGLDGSRTVTGQVLIGQTGETNLISRFTASTFSGDAPLPVQFNEFASGTISSYLWDFGDGTTSSELNPAHTYQNAGTYYPSLTVSDGLRTATSVGQIVVNTPYQLPVAAFTMSPETGQAPLAVQFTDSSTGTINSWIWDFGDGNISTARNPQHNYSEDGLYMVTLSITGPKGQSSVQQNIIVNRSLEPVVAKFTAIPQAPLNPLGLVFDSTNSQGDIAQYAWDFGDGSTSTLAIPQHTYSAEGTYTVTLVLHGIDGSQSSNSQEISVVNIDLPTADFVASPWGGPAPLNVNFSDASYPGNAEIVTWYWEFGTGVSSHEQNPSYQYTLPGVYSVTLTVRDSEGFLSTQLHEITVTEPDLLARCGISNDIVFDGEMVNFRNLSYGKTIASSLWDFGDGTTSTELNPSHLYPANGSYTVTLTVTSDDGDTDSATCNTRILAPDEFVVRFNVNRDEGAAPLLISVDNTSVGNITSYEWSWGDGTSSTEAQPGSHVYNLPGTYIISLTGRNAAGESQTATRTIYVYRPLEVSINAAPTVGVAPMRGNFSGFANGTVWSWEWDLGNGIRRTGQNITYVYTSPGTYTVSLRATGPAGVATSQVTIEVVESGNIQAAFRAQPYAAFPAQEICFTNLSSGSISSYLWDFGDGSTSTSRDACHSYSTPNDYRVSLHVSGVGGSGAAVNTIQIFDPNLNAGSIYYEPYGDFAVCFYTDELSGEASMQWLFGDGSSSSNETPCHRYPSTGTYTVILIIEPVTGSPSVSFLNITVVAGGQIPPSPTPTATPIATLTATTRPSQTPRPSQTSAPVSSPVPSASPSPSLVPSTIAGLPNSEISETATATDETVTATTSLATMVTATASPSPTIGTGNENQGVATLVASPSLTVTPIEVWDTPASIPVNYCGMTLYGQDSPYSCLAASLCTIISVSNITDENCVPELRESLESLGVLSDKGGALELVPDILNDLGRLGTLTEYSQVYSRLIALYQEGYQMLLPLQVIDDDVLHSVVLVSIDEQSITYADPLTGSIISRSREDFTNLWNGTVLAVPAALWCLPNQEIPAPPKQIFDPSNLLLILSAGTIAALTAISGGSLGMTTMVAGINGIIQNSQIGVWVLKQPGATLGTSNRIRAYPDGTRFVAYEKCARDGYIWMRVTMSDGTQGWMASNWSNVNTNALPVWDGCGGGSGGGGGVEVPGLGRVPVPDNTPLYGTLPLPTDDNCPGLRDKVLAANRAIEKANSVHRDYLWAVNRVQNRENERDYARRMRDNAQAQLSEAQKKVIAARELATRLYNEQSWWVKAWISAESGLVEFIRWVLGGLESLAKYIPGWAGGDEIRKKLMEAWDAVDYMKVGHTVGSWALDAVRNILNGAISFMGNFTWFPGVKGLLDKARGFRDDMNNRINDAQYKLNKYNQIVGDAVRARSEVTRLERAIKDNDYLRLYWQNNYIRKERELAEAKAWQDEVWRYRQAAIASRNAAIDLVYRQGEACLAEQYRMEDLAKKLEALTGIPAATWLNTAKNNNSTLGRFDDGDNLKKLVDWFSQLKDVGISDQSRKLIAEKVINSDWDEWHVWTLATDYLPRMKTLGYSVGEMENIIENAISGSPYSFSDLDRMLKEMESTVYNSKEGQASLYIWDMIGNSSQPHLFPPNPSGRPIIFNVHGWSNDGATGDYQANADWFGSNYGSLPDHREPILIGINWDGSDGAMSLPNYDDIEERARLTGQRVGKLLEYYQQDYNNIPVTMIAHSMGNQVVMNLVETNVVNIDNYIGIQPAVKLYDESSNMIEGRYDDILVNNEVQDIYISYAWDDGALKFKYFPNGPIENWSIGNFGLWEDVTETWSGLTIEKTFDPNLVHNYDVSGDDLNPSDFNWGHQSIGLYSSNDDVQQMVKDAMQGFLYTTGSDYTPPPPNMA